jgi:C4-dicarboxylate-specific signal transduction histidine kinase
MSTTEDREAAFIGKITAGATHELRNVLAIVKESAGLIADIVDSSSRHGSPNPEKLIRAVGRIEAQVKRGSELLTSLNRFAHSLDHAEDEIDLDEAAQQVSSLSQRAARKGRHLVEARPGDRGLSVVVNLLRLQMALHAAVECCLEQLPEGGALTLQAVRHGGRSGLEFNGEAEGEAVSLAPTEAAAWGRLAAALEVVGASVEQAEAARGFRVILSD